jgi:hypothetical protein
VRRGHCSVRQPSGCHALQRQPARCVAKLVAAATRQNRLRHVHRVAALLCGTAASGTLVHAAITVAACALRRQWHRRLPTHLSPCRLRDRARSCAAACEPRLRQVFNASVHVYRPASSAVAAARTCLRFGAPPQLPAALHAAVGSVFLD